MKKFFIIVIILFSSNAYAENYINTVKRYGFSDCSIGFEEMFSSINFDNAKWDKFKSINNGPMVVEFSGEISKNLHDSVVTRYFKKDFESLLFLQRIANLTVPHEELLNIHIKWYNKDNPKNDILIAEKQVEYYFENYFWKTGDNFRIQFVFYSGTFSPEFVQCKTIEGKYSYEKLESLKAFFCK